LQLSLRIAATHSEVAPRRGTTHLPCMRALGIVLGALLVAVGVTPALAKDAGAPAPGLPACIDVKTESRYVPYGYNHVVIIKNGCSKAATCTVSTDVNPQPTTAEIAAGATSEILTFAGSPSQTFTAKASCKLAK
jgi:hypothetical protein